LKLKWGSFICRATIEEWGILGHAELTGPTAERKLGQLHPDQSSQWAAGVEKWRTETENTRHAEMQFTEFQKTQIFSEVRL